MEEHLRELEAYRFVSRDAAAGDANESRWHAVAKGFVFEIPDDPAGEAAARGLSNVTYLSYVDLPRRWVADDEPRLPLEWVRAAGLFNARVTVTPDELRGIQEGVERLLAPFIRRGAANAPATAGPVRILS
jgi:hypothetical protein